MRLRITLLALSMLALFPIARGSQISPRDPAIVVPQLRALGGEVNLAQVRRILGAPDETFVSGATLCRYRLADGSSVVVSLRDEDRVFIVLRSAPGGNVTTLYEYLHVNLLAPVPTSAPF